MVRREWGKNRRRMIGGYLIPLESRHANRRVKKQRSRTIFPSSASRSSFSSCFWPSSSPPQHLIVSSSCVARRLTSLSRCHSTTDDTFSLRCHHPGCASEWARDKTQFRNVHAPAFLLPSSLLTLDPELGLKPQVPI